MELLKEFLKVRSLSEIISSESDRIQISSDIPQKIRPEITPNISSLNYLQIFPEIPPVGISLDEKKSSIAYPVILIIVSSRILP